MDCVDGNLARSVKQQPFGDFVDATSSYVLVGLLGVSLGINCFQNGGLLFTKGSVYIVLLGALASSSDTLMRLIYQKYKATSNDLQNRGIIPTERDVRTEHQSVSSLRVRLEMELGIAGVIPFLVILCTLTNSLDALIIYMVLYYGGSCIVLSTLYTIKALKYRNTDMK
jgi:phosphatidylglycerophosphate synthase